MTLTKTELTALQKMMPDYRSDFDNKHQSNLKLIESQHSEGGKFTTKDIFFKSFYTFLLEIEGLIEQGLTINATKSRARLGTSGAYSITFNLTPKMVEDSLSTATEKEIARFKSQVEHAQQQWVDIELQELLEEAENAKVKEAKEQTKATKKALLSKLVESI